MASPLIRAAAAGPDPNSTGSGEGAARREGVADATVELAESIRAISVRLSRRLREQSTVGDYTQSQKNVIGHLDREGTATLSALARAEGMKPQSMAAILAMLKDASIVQSTPDPNDGRQIFWSLTDGARETVLSGRATRTDWLTRAIGDALTVDEEAQLRRGIELLAVVIDGRAG